jgi:hypothetical protein
MPAMAPATVPARVSVPSVVVAWSATIAMPAAYDAGETGLFISLGFSL